MDILRKTLDLVVSNIENILATTDGKADGPIIDTLRLAMSCRDMAYSMKGARRWVEVEERQPSTSGVYETIVVSGRHRFVTYNEYESGEWEHSGVTHWRKQPKLPKA